MKIGVSIFIHPEGLSWWTCGALQNVAFLATCLRAGGHDVRILNGGNGPNPEQSTLPISLQGIPWLPVNDETVGDLNVLIQAGAQVSAAHVEMVRAKGGRAVAFKFGADFPIDAERAIHGQPSGAIFNGAKFDEIWTTTQHEETCGAYWQICYRAPVRVLPHLWSPIFVDQKVAAFPPGTVAGYQPGRAKKRIVIFEPNIQLLKTCHIPILICEEAWRRVPEKIDFVLVTNAERLKPNEAFSTFVNNLDLVKSKSADGHPIVSFEARYDVPGFMTLRGDVVVSHQWITAANYCHYDLLHLGYPLVHNVPELERWGIGYYYPKFDALQGAESLVRCLEWCDDETYRVLRHAGICAFLRTRHADNPVNVEAHARAIERLFV